MNDYIVNPHDEHAYHAYEDIKHAVANARKHESYLTAQQIAMAIVSGLKEWGADQDGQAVGKEVAELAGFIQPVHG